MKSLSRWLHLSSLLRSRRGRSHKHHVAMRENPPLSKNRGAVCSDGPCTVVLRCILSQSTIKSKLKLLGFPWSAFQVLVLCSGFFVCFPAGVEPGSFLLDPSGSRCPVFLLLFSSSRRSLQCLWGGRPVKFCDWLGECTASGSCAGREGAGCRKPLRSSLPRGRGYCPTTGRFLILPLKQSW